MPTVPNQQQSNSSQSDSSDFRYFKSEKPGLTVIVGDPDPTKGEVAPKTVRFVPYFVYERGKEGKQKYGYLKTRNGSVLKKLDGDIEVQEIKKSEYEEATKEVRDESGEQISGFRAPY